MEEDDTTTPLLGQSIKDSAKIGKGDTNLSDTKFGKSQKTKKTILTLMSFIGFFALGNTMAMYGPTLQDLVLTTNSDTSTMATVLVVRSAGSLVGAFLVGVLLKRFDPWLQLGLALLIMGGMTIAVPRIPNIPAIFVVFLLLGVAGAFYDAGGNVMLLRVWGDEHGPWMQALHCVFGLGTLMAPLLAEPFLSDQATLEPPADLSNDSWAYTESTPGQMNTSVNSATMLDSGTQIKWAYLIVGIMCCFSAFLIFTSGVFCGIGQILEGDDGKKSSVGEAVARKENIFRYTLITLVFFFYASYCAVEIGVANYLASFAIYLGWTKSAGAMVTSAFWASFTIGRALGIPLVRYVHINAFLIANTTVSVVALVPVMAFASVHPAVLWTSMVVLGFGLSTIYATGITWLERHVKITPAVGTTFLVGSTAGDLFATFVIGFLFDATGARIFGYAIFAVACLMGLILGVMLLMGWRHGERIREKC